LHPTTAPARRFFERRFNAMMRAFGSPKIPRTVGCGRKPANEYVSQSRRWRLDARAIRKSCQISQPSKCRIPLQSPLFSRFQPQNRPLDSTKTHYFYNPSSPSNPDVIWDFEDHAPASTIATDRIAVMGPAGTAANYKEFTIGYNNGYGLAQDFADYYIHKGADYVFVTDSVNGYLFADITDSDAIEMGFILMGLNDVSDFNYSNIVNVDNYNDNLYLNVNVYDFL
jgi:hypothetical protein